MTKFPDLFASLAAEFEPGEVKQRSQAGRSFRYITARAVENRLDECLGPENWWDHYIPGQNSVICQLTIRLPDGEKITKENAGGYAGMADSGDDDKSGFSDAIKRAAARFGVGRYLYGDGTADLTGEGHAHQPAPTPAPAPARNGGSSWGNTADRGEAPRRPASNGNGNGGGERKQYDGPPRSGKALFAFVKQTETDSEVKLLSYLNNWSKLQDFPGRMIDWDAEQVSLAYAEAMRKLGGSAETEGGTADDRDHAETGAY